MDSEEIRLDPNELTLGEGEEFEELTGLAIASLKPGAAIPSKALSVLVYLVKRRSNPDYTLDDARRIRYAELAGPKD